MATPRPTKYSMKHGETCYGGRSAPAAPLPSWVAALPLWQVYDIPNTALKSVEPTNLTGIAGGDGPQAKIVDWCGATLRRQNSVYMLGAAGGHSGYYGNETDGVVLNSETPHWSELRAHSALSDMYNQVTVNADGRKSSTHTYWFTQYDNVNDRMMLCVPGGPYGTLSAAPAGYPYNTAGSGNTPAPNVTCAFDWATQDWLLPTTLPSMPYTTSSGDLCCSNPWTSEIYVCGDSKGTLLKFDPTTQAWVSVGNWFLNGGYAGSAVDPKRNRILVVGDYGGTRAPFLRSTVDASAISAAFSGVALNPAAFAGNYPGVIYDEANDNFVVAANNSTTGSIDFYRVDAATLMVDRPTLSGSITNRINGIHNSIQYVPELRGFAIANSYTGNLKFVRTHL